MGATVVVEHVQITVMVVLDVVKLVEPLAQLLAVTVLATVLGNVGESATLLVLQIALDVALVMVLVRAVKLNVLEVARAVLVRLADAVALVARDLATLDVETDVFLPVKDALDVDILVPLIVLVVQIVQVVAVVAMDVPRLVKLHAQLLVMQIVKEHAMVLA